MNLSEKKLNNIENKLDEENLYTSQISLKMNRMKQYNLKKSITSIESYLRKDPEEVLLNSIDNRK